MAHLLIGLGYLAVYAALGRMLRGHPLALTLFGTAALLVSPAVVLAVILRRRRRWAGCQRLFWDTFAIGVGLWMIGHVGWAIDDLHGDRSWLRWHTLFSLCGGIGPLIALFARPHRGVRFSAVGTVGVVLASYGLLSVFVYSYFVLVPSVLPGGGNAQVMLLGLVQINRALLFAAMATVAIVARNTAWRTSYIWLALGTGIGFFLRITTSLAIARGEYQSGTLYDLAWIAPFLCYAGAALASPDSPSVEPGRLSTAPVLHPTVAAVPVFLIPLIGYTTLYIQPLGGTGDSFRALLTGLMTVAGLGLLTVRLAVQGGELQRADARMRLLAAATEQTGDLILITGADGRFEHANDAFVRALGYSRAELVDLTFNDLTERGFDNLGGHISSEVRTRGIWRGTLLRRRRDRTTFPAACTVVGLKDPAGGITHYVGVERDITDEIKLRDQLVHSERLSAIGELVAGVAHEINNPLQTIVGSVELLLEEYRDPAARQDLEVVRREAARAGQIVRNLLSFVRRGAPNRVPADLNDIARATVELREYHLRQNNISLVLDLQPEPAPVLVNREEIQQIVLNLVLNAEQAILSAARAGTITVCTRSMRDRHVLEVIDDGPGIDAELGGRVFEPFFTTKEVGEGTGLGLSISHGIASAHGGSLDLCSTSAGACFRLTLPAYIESSQPAASAEARRGSAPRALVVDDEVPIRRLLGRLLERRGFDVIEADTGKAALAHVEQGALRLVLCDVKMPGIGGVELYRSLTSRDPALAGAFIFMTGDTAAIAEEDAALLGVPVLVKPFSAADLDTLLDSLGIDAAPLSEGTVTG